MLQSRRRSATQHGAMFRICEDLPQLTYEGLRRERTGRVPCDLDERRPQLGKEPRGLEIAVYNGAHMQRSASPSASKVEESALFLQMFRDGARFPVEQSPWIEELSAGGCLRPAPFLHAHHPYVLPLAALGPVSCSYEHTGASDSGFSAGVGGNLLAF